MIQSVASPLLRYSDDFAEDPTSLVASACKMKLEGIIGKRGDAPYRSGRSNDWIKLKCNLRQEFVIGGFSRVKGAKTGVRSLLLGVYEQDGTLRYAGHVAPHLTPSRSAAFNKRAQALFQPQPTFYNAPEPERDREFHWLAPDIVAEVSFLEWTPNGEIRHPVFMPCAKTSLRGRSRKKRSSTIHKQGMSARHGNDPVPAARSWWATSRSATHSA